MSYLARRLGFYLLAAWASVTMAFAIPRMMPGDPLEGMLVRFQGKLRPEALPALRDALGLTGGSLLDQYLSYLRHLLRGDLGLSISQFPATVTSVVGGALLWTLFLCGLAVALSFVLGTTLGVVAAWRRGRWLDQALPPVLILVGALPYFWLAMLALFLFGVTLEWFPVRHAYDAELTVAPTWEFAASVLEHAVLPALTIVVATVGGWMLAMRNTMIRTLAEDHVLLARAKGLPERRIMFQYAARNALLPNVTAFGMDLGFVLSGALLTEIVFSYPGQGYLLLRAVQSLDYPLIQGLFLTITAAVLGANWLVDVAHVWLDPRTRRS
jgi:peptide/nickel transport system permease protein